MSAELEKDWRILFLRLIKSEMLYQHSVIGTAEGRGEGGRAGAVEIRTQANFLFTREPVWPIGKALGR